MVVVVVLVELDVERRGREEDVGEVGTARERKREGGVEHQERSGKEGQESTGNCEAGSKLGECVRQPIRRASF